MTDIVEETRQFVKAFQQKHPGKRIAITSNGLELVPVEFEIDLEETQRRREQIRTINQELVGAHDSKRARLHLPRVKGFRHKLVDIFEHSAFVVVHALEVRLKVVQEELALLRHTRQRDLTPVERLQLQDNLQELSQEELAEQIDPWITLEDTIKGLIEDFSFGE
jgi:hypothetical protein